MKLLVFIAFLIIGSITFDSFMEDYARNPLDDEDLKEVLKNKSAESEKLKKSFDQILVQEKQRPVVKKVPVKTQVKANVEPTRTTTPIDYMNPEEIHQIFYKKWLESPKEGMDYLRSAMANEKVSISTKEEVLDIVSQSNFPKTEFSYFTREVLAQTENPYFFRKILYLHSELISLEGRETLIIELLERTQNPELREIILEYSSQAVPVAEQL